MARTAKKGKKPQEKLKPVARRACDECVHSCGVDASAIDEMMCQLEQLGPRLETDRIVIFKFTRCLANRCRAMKIPVEVWLEDEILSGLQLGFCNMIRQNNIPVVRDTDGEGVQRRHDSTISHCYNRTSRLPLHHCAPEIQLAAMPHLNTLFQEVLNQATHLAESLDEVRKFDCIGMCCPFISRCC